ncbi:TIGR03086 family metal-binding protein [Streptomyces sp. NPDC046759]|uniref:TIGR03086 family metal-binding protein n=1 Tax=Streptomyces sp. NPDC046759 TaxID=3155019 RepID=UPI0033C15551
MTTQHSTLNPAIRECAEAIAVIASGIRDDQLQNRTPCEKFTVAELVGHFTEVLRSSVRAARKEGEPGADAAAGVSPRELAGSAQLVAAAWSDPAAYEGTTEFVVGEMPAAFAASLTLQEMALHAWDLARATGRPFAPGEETGRLTLGVVEQVAEQARSNGVFGPAVPVGDDEPAFRRALGRSGRNPGWNG